MRLVGECFETCLNVLMHQTDFAWEWKMFWQDSVRESFEKFMQVMSVQIIDWMSVGWVDRLE